MVVQQQQTPKDTRSDDGLGFFFFYVYYRPLLYPSFGQDEMLVKWAEATTSRVFHIYTPSTTVLRLARGHSSFMTVSQAKQSG